MNAREQLLAIATWLGDQNETLSDGLKSVEDAIKLWRFAQKNENLEEFADTWDAKNRKQALRYDPLDHVY